MNATATAAARFLLFSLFLFLVRGEEDCVLLTKESSLREWGLRDAHNQTDVDPTLWATCCGSWGPPSAQYPSPSAAEGFDGSSSAAAEWLRDRVVSAAAFRWRNLTYEHHHIPAFLGTAGNETSGLDCSNFAAWVYNYAIGRKFTSAVAAQSALPFARVESLADCHQGDLLYFFDEAHSAIVHAGVFCWTAANRSRFGVVHSTGPGVQLSTDVSRWPFSRFSHALRPIADDGEDLRSSCSSPEDSASFAMVPAASSFGLTALLLQLWI